ncbi:UbiA-like polyprenyltransferase [Gorillibacterium massiliense]|uniref:UbiA-like polyprenyltransferase n=1 Tax=Gorillibacterium massiliense TaxID=1280390 RepID=UPI0004AEA5B8|nr:UbiA-like polyprenyltransferase [Gorillibacterium massiliense]
MFHKIKVFLDMIKIEHTLFALPFAYMGAILGSAEVNGRFPTWMQILWVTLAMVGARSAAFGLNRLLDRYIDKKNPRTAGRAIPAGKLSVAEVVIFIIVSFVVFFWATAELSALAMKLLPIAVFCLTFYSYTKRFTWLCHIVLGLTIALAPLGGWVAVTNHCNWTAMIFYFSIALWTAGFDIIYACQDVKYDREDGLYSIPSRFGIANALIVAKVLHFLTAVGLTSLFFLTDLGWWYFAGIIISYVILFYEHWIVNPNDMVRVNTAFFTMNAALSILVFVACFVDLAVKLL